MRRIKDARARHHETKQYQDILPRVISDILAYAYWHSVEVAYNMQEMDTVSPDPDVIRLVIADRGGSQPRIPLDG